MRLKEYGVLITTVVRQVSTLGINAPIINVSSHSERGLTETAAQALATAIEDVRPTGLSNIATVFQTGRWLED